MSIFLQEKIVSTLTLTNKMDSMAMVAHGIDIINTVLFKVSQEKLFIAGHSWTVGGSQNNIDEESHYSSTNEPRDGNCNKPGDEDIPEKTPVN